MSLKPIYLIIAITISLSFPLLVLIFSTSGGDPLTEQTSSIHDLRFSENVFSETEIIDEARLLGIDRIDIPHFCPIPTKSGINECLMYSFQDSYGKGIYQGEKAHVFNHLLYEFLQGEKSKSDVVDHIYSLSGWIEDGTTFLIPGLKQFVVTDINIDTHKTSSQLSNEIWAELMIKGLLHGSAYEEVLIIYDDKTKMNTIGILSINFIFIEEGWD
ncbi:hypothetical protein [Bacillus alkalicellulosilyticus]|uniref:hypothetical protein n=1 Tax=Alkalihalobacterium alkalicellulosilyticum TaxID=1912214 RepID=UPI0009983406|nr:hypothetical protein [Bacillus alkalicellulosilyticus]